MAQGRCFYTADLAHIHDVAFHTFSEGCAPGILELCGDAGIRNGLVVDLGCGSGILAKHLCAAGYQVFGLDVSPAMIEMARRRVPSATFQSGSLWSEPIPRCRAVTALGEVFSYSHPHENDAVDRGEPFTRTLRALFRKVFDALDPGGLLIFDMAEVGLDRNRKPTVTQADDWACLVSFEYDETRDRLTRHITTFRRTGELFRRSQERHVLQLVTASEVAGLLRTVGFRVRYARRFGTQPLLPGRAGFVARKP